LSHPRLFENIREVFTSDDGAYVVWLRNSALYAVTSAIGAALLAALAGYGFARFEFRGRDGMFWFVLGSIMVPTNALVIPTYLLFAKVGLTNSPLSIILPSLVSPFGIYLMRVYAAGSVPHELLEAARLDGAGELRIFSRIAFRLLVPGFVTVLLFNFVATWNNYFLPLMMLSQPKWYPLTVGLPGWNHPTQFNVVTTGALLSVIPLVAAFLMLGRYWQSGLEVGGVKG
jgi:multiple sugar transport system permease protein